MNLNDYLSVACDDSPMPTSNYWSLRAPSGMPTYNHCCSFEQLGNESHVEMPALAKLANNDLEFAKRIAYWKPCSGSNQEALERAQMERAHPNSLTFP